MQAGGGAAAAAARWPAAFSVSYANAASLTGSFWYAWQTMLVVMLVLAGGPVWVWRVSVCEHKGCPTAFFDALLACQASSESATQIYKGSLYSCSHPVLQSNHTPGHPLHAQARGAAGRHRAHPVRGPGCCRRVQRDARGGAGHGVTLLARADQAAGAHFVDACVCGGGAVCAAASACRLPPQPVWPSTFTAPAHDHRRRCTCSCPPMPACTTSG